MPLTYACALRWADMDLLGHVNNVRYLEFLAAARDAAFGGRPAGRARVRAHRVEFAAPLVFSRTPVLVDTWVTAIAEDSVTLAHEVYAQTGDEHDGERVTHVRAATELDHRLDDEERAMAAAMAGEDHEWRPLAADVRPGRASYDVHLRPSDLGPDGHVRDVAVFELLQESRVRYIMDLHTRGQEWSQHVIARKDVRYREPIPWRGESDPAYSVHSWIGHVGTRSFTIGAEWRDGDRVLADASVVVVTFDASTQRPAPMADSQRARLEVELSTPSS